MNSEMKLLVFTVTDDEYGCDINRVNEVRRIRKITRIPQAPGFIEGVIKLRGKVIPLIDFRKRLGLPSIEHGKATRIIIAHIGKRVLGFIVDTAREVLTLSGDQVEPPESVFEEVAFLQGVGKVPGRMILIVDLENLLTLKEKNLLPAVE